jgi:hypothetical protein
MKFSLALCILLLIACNDETENKPVTDTTAKRDTPIISRVNQNPYAAVDLSPMDISYFPVDYPIQKMANKITGPPIMRVIYSRPHKQGRKIFGSLLKYGEPWRLGANEATEIEFFQPVTIQNQKVSRGRFIIYCVPNEKTWTIVLNTNVYSWGLKPDPKQDVYKFEIPVERPQSSIEFFTMVFEKAIDGGASLLITWDDVLVRLPVKF